ncbi:hypothetical protein Hanom_Chr13g01190631 [Helianthus anomalus]
MAWFRFMARVSTSVPFRLGFSFPATDDGASIGSVRIPVQVRLSSGFASVQVWVSVVPVQVHVMVYSFQSRFETGSVLSYNHQTRWSCIEDLSAIALVWDTLHLFCCFNRCLFASTKSCIEHDHINQLFGFCRLLILNKEDDNILQAIEVVQWGF